MRTLTPFAILLAAAFAAEPQPKNDYSKDDAWLCRPGRAGDACSADLTTTVITAKGKMKVEKWTAHPNPPVDCFYVYPTVSTDATGNSDMIAGIEEKRVAQHQFQRFGSQCRLYAPLYRQITLTALRANLSGKAMPMDRALAYNDVLDAWNRYLQHDNAGRGVVLIGHSQGSGVLTQLIKQEIDGKPAQARMISALLLGTTLPVPKGKDVGGAFQNVPLCRAATQTGCAVAYASFRADEPPPSATLFGRVGGTAMSAACVNPAALAGGSAPLHAYLAAGNTAGSSALEPKPWVNPPKPVSTPFVSVPGLLSAECVADERVSYLAVKVHGDPSDPRVDDIAGDIYSNGQKQTGWGLHLIDAHLAMGDLVELAGKQAKAYLAKQAK